MSARRIFEHFFLMLGLFFVCGEPFRFIHTLMGSSVDGYYNDPLRKVVWLTVYAAAAVPFFLHFRQIAWLWSRNLSLLFLTGLIVLSVAWAPEPLMCATYVLSYLGTMVVASYFALRYSARDMVLLVADTFGFVALASLLVSLVWPSYGLMEGTHEGAWRGIFGHKNNMGCAMVVGMFLSIEAARVTVGLRRRIFGAQAALCAVLVAFSNSATAYFVTGFLAVLWPATRALLNGKVHRYRFWQLATLYAVCACVLLAILPDLIELSFSLVGRRSDLTDRLPLWQGALSAIADHPWLGYGYNVFWEADKGLAFSYIGPYLNWDSPHAHNGFIELALNLGLVGVAVLLANLVIAAKRVWWQAAASPEMPRDIGLLILLLLIMMNLTEVSLVQANSIIWLLYVWFMLRSAYVRYQVE